MNRHIVISLTIIFFSACSGEKQPPVTLWYQQPATEWNEALPIGNGRLGAMVYGRTDKEVLQLNDNTLYSGEPSTAWKGVDIAPTYEEAVAMLRAGKYAEATDFLQKHWLGCLHQNYQPLGEWHLDSHTVGEVTDYRRELDLANSLLRISYKQNGISYTREIFASYPDDVIVVRLRCDKKDGLDITTSLTSIHPTARQTVSHDGLCLHGQAPGYAERRTLEQIEEWGFQNKHPELFHPDGSRKFDKQVLYGDEIDGRGTFFHTCVKTTAPNAIIRAEDDGLRISGADEIVFVLSSATSFNGFDKSPSREGRDAAAIAEEAWANVALKSYDQLKARHTKDYQALFNRVCFEMPATPEQQALPTDQRIVRYNDLPDNDLVALLYQYGRYLMISGSRPG